MGDRPILFSAGTSARSEAKMGEQSPDYDLHRQQIAQARQAEREQVLKEAAMFLKIKDHADLAADLLRHMRAKG